MDVPKFTYCPPTAEHVVPNFQFFKKYQTYILIF